MVPVLLGESGFFCFALGSTSVMHISLEVGVPCSIDTQNPLFKQLHGKTDGYPCRYGVQPQFVCETVSSNNAIHIVHTDLPAKGIHGLELRTFGKRSRVRPCTCQVPARCTGTENALGLSNSATFTPLNS